jgi:hypothetical protein
MKVYRRVSVVLIAIAALPLIGPWTPGGEPAVRDVWATLHRPLHIPHLQRGAKCPRSRGGRAAPATGYTIGRGPVYPVLGFSDPPPDPRGVIHFRDGHWRWGWDWLKTLWAFDPRYGGPVLIRGRGLDGTSPIHFFISPRRYVELRFPAHKKRRWTYQPSDSGFRHPGCYAFQIDGMSFSRVVIFKVVKP